jgi:hypothetical protein
VTTLWDAFPRSQPVHVTMPWLSAERICDRARSEWGDRAVVGRGESYSVVLQWLQTAGPARRRDGAAPVCAFRIRWGSPTVHQATIDRIAWEPKLGASPDEVKEVINQLAGWPAATLATLAV